MTIYSDKFFRAFDYLMDNYGDYISTLDEYPYIMHNPQEMIEIVESLKRGEREAFDRGAELKKFLEKIVDYLEYKHDGMHHRMPSEYNKGAEIYNKEVEIIYIIENYLLPYFEIPVMELFGIMTADERMALRSIARQKKLPVEMKNKIREYIGIVPKGGKTKRKRTSRHRKNKRNKTEKRHKK